MKRIFRSGLAACLVTFVQPQPVHAAPFTIDHEMSWFAADTESSDIGRIAPLGGHVEAEWVESGLARYFRFRGGSSIEVAPASHRQSIARTTLSEGTPISVTAVGAFEVRLQGLEFDIVGGDARDLDPASSLSWMTIGTMPAIEGTLDVTVSSALGNIDTTFEYSGRLRPEQDEDGFRPSRGTVQLEEAFLLLPFDLAFELSIESISGGDDLDSSPVVLSLVEDFLSRQRFRYYGELVALAANEPPPASVSAPQTLALLVVGLALAGLRRRRDGAFDAQASTCPSTNDATEK